MRCPYLLKSKTEIQVWNQTPDDNQTITDGTNGTKTIYEYEQCVKADCGAYCGGKCNFNNTKD